MRISEFIRSDHPPSLPAAGCGGCPAAAPPVPGLVLVYVPGSGPHAVWNGGWRSLPVPLLLPGGECAADFANNHTQTEPEQNTV